MILQKALLYILYRYIYNYIDTYTQKIVWVNQPGVHQVSQINVKNHHVPSKLLYKLPRIVVNSPLNPLLKLP